MSHCRYFLFFFFFNDTATTEIYTLSLHDALPISVTEVTVTKSGIPFLVDLPILGKLFGFSSEQESRRDLRSEEHTSELQSQSNLVCRLLLEKKKKQYTSLYTFIVYTGMHARVTMS